MPASHLKSHVTLERSSARLTAICCEAEILAEERQHMVLEAVGDCADMRAGIDFKSLLSGYKSNKVNWLPISSKSLSQSDA
jgi:hypothetical protein